MSKRKGSWLKRTQQHRKSGTQILWRSCCELSATLGKWSCYFKELQSREKGSLIRSGWFLDKLEDWRCSHGQWGKQSYHGCWCRHLGFQCGLATRKKVKGGCRLESVEWKRQANKCSKCHLARENWSFAVGVSKGDTCEIGVQEVS